jgi:hypothetical protein
LEQGPSPHFLGLRQARTVFEDVGTVAFFGWTSDIGTVAIRFQGRTYATRPVIVPSGADAARLWAHQMIATNSIRDPERVLAMSLEYGILSPVTEIASVGNAEPIPTIKARLPLP